MSTQRGAVPSALIASTIVLILCAVGWGALGVLSFAVGEFNPLAFRFLTSLLATLTLGAIATNLHARTASAIRAEIAAHRDAIAESKTVCGYAEGYTDALAAAPVSPAVSRLVPGRR